MDVSAAGNANDVMIVFTSTSTSKSPPVEVSVFRNMSDVGTSFVVM